MKYILTIIITISITMLFSCSNKSEKAGQQDKQQEKYSRVLDFNYGGYGDNVYAFLNGNIDEYDSSGNFADSLKPLQNVLIKVEQNGKSILTDTNGQFTLGFEKGIFSVLVTKEGYQFLKIKNYVSDPDQISTVKIVLEKGNELQTFTIPKSKK